VTPSSDPLPTDLAAAHEMIVAQREMLSLAQGELTVSRLEIERYKLMLAKARREQYGQSSERARHLIEQLELAIEDLEETQAAEQARVEMTSPTGVKEKQALHAILLTLCRREPVTTRVGKKGRPALTTRALYRLADRL
jgi:transposase